MNHATYQYRSAFPLPCYAGIIRSNAHRKHHGKRPGDRTGQRAEDPADPGSTQQGMEGEEQGRNQESIWRTGERHDPTHRPANVPMGLQRQSTLQKFGHRQGQHAPLFPLQRKHAGQDQRIHQITFIARNPRRKTNAYEHAVRR